MHNTRVIKKWHLLSSFLTMVGFFSINFRVVYMDIIIIKHMNNLYITFALRT